jgi:hypothetical protein
VDGIELLEIFLLHEGEYLSIELLNGLMILRDLDCVVGFEYGYLFTLVIVTGNGLTWHCLIELFHFPIPFSRGILLKLS